MLNNLWAAPMLVLYRLITECLFGYEIQAAATIGRRFTIHHGYAVVINKTWWPGMISLCVMASLSAIVEQTARLSGDWQRRGVGGQRGPAG